MKEENCNHEWVSILSFSAYGKVYRSECVKCGCVGELSSKPDEKGLYQIVARPLANVVDLNEFRKRKEIKNVH
jgi:hypothetical protein